LPTWKDDVAVWENAVRYEPENWWAWYLKATGEVAKADAQSDPTSARPWLERAQNSYRKSLAIAMPPKYIGAMLLNLALVTNRLGDGDQAQIYASRALQLNPDLASAWAEKRPPQERD
jgi:tetratricopeptide (TPR) repeat protein